MLIADYTVKFEPAVGEIGAHENRKVTITFFPHRVPGESELEILLCCDVAGMDLPIGCLLKAKIEGLSISYSILNSTRPAILSKAALDWIPHSIPQSTTLPPAPSCDPIDLPISPTLPAINFPPIPIFSQQSTMLVFRNNTAMPTRFFFTIRKYNPPNKAYVQTWDEDESLSKPNSPEGYD